MKYSLLKIFYNVVRKTPLLNYLAHKVIQSEAINRFPPYKSIYTGLINKKASKLLRAPSILELTLTDTCNARCIMCPPQVHRGKTIMSREVFEKTVREGADLGIQKMVITGGEALLDRSLEEKIKYAKQHGFEVQLFTNGSLMQEGRARSIIASGLDTLTWSIDSVYAEEYEKIRVGLDFNKVKTNISRFMRIRRQMRRKLPLTRINMVALPENRNSRKDFRRLFGPLVDVVEIIDAHNWGQGGFISGEDKEYSQTTRYPCHLLFSKLVVWPDGTVRKCSIDYSPDAQMGILGENSLQEIFQCERMQSIKNAHLNSDFSEPGCVNCTFKESWWVKAV